MRIEIVGADDLRQTLGEIPNRVRNVSRKAMQLAVGLIHRYAVSVVPVRTGRLKNSLFWKADYENGENSLTGVVGTNVKYSPHVEFGTEYMAERPYMRPAVENNMAAINSIFNDQIGNTLHG